MRSKGMATMQSTNKSDVSQSLDRSAERRQAYKDARIFKALADPRRLQIIELLKWQDGDLCVLRLTEELGCRQPTTSHHLAILRNAGLIEADERGTYTYYYLCQDTYSRVAEIVQRRLQADDQALHNPAAQEQPVLRLRGSKLRRSIDSLYSGEGEEE